LTFLAAFIPLSFLRSTITGIPWQTELAPITWPMFQLFIFFMITDPPTTTKKEMESMPGGRPGRNHGDSAAACIQGSTLALQLSIHCGADVEPGRDTADPRFREDPTSTWRSSGLVRVQLTSRGCAVSHAARFRHACRTLPPRRLSVLRLSLSMRSHSE